MRPAASNATPAAAINPAFNPVYGRVAVDEPLVVLTGEELVLVVPDVELDEAATDPVAELDELLELEGALGAL